MPILIPTLSDYDYKSTKANIYLNYFFASCELTMMTLLAKVLQSSANIKFHHLVKRALF